MYIKPVDLSVPESEQASRSSVESTRADASFVDELKDKIEKVDQLQHSAEKAMQEGAIKGAQDIHEAMIRLQEAEISLRFLIQVRNKALEAYREIMRMQI
ncbi:MAG: flagellar hook-basal body complex protein FliE [Deltaproteobacteria bacterium]|nr:flagellar hook-basal body complex protein FliE [Deltaproteobacteria bacterium]MBW2068628.1 flagellar hook-basal body complex protein FliE [Deltaproteobacteria bacterium]